MDETCVVVAMYNEASTVADVVSSLRLHFDHIVCVDDGSRDDSAALARAAGARVLRHPVNLGQGAALQTGFDYVLRHTDAEYCVTFDADGQHVPEDAVRMVRTAQETRVDVVLASRFLDTTPALPRLRRMTLKAALVFSKWYDGLAVTDTNNGLRVLSREALMSFRLTLPRMAHASELQYCIARQKLSYLEVPARVIYTDYSRAKGQSNVNALNILFDLTMRRLRATA